MDLPTSSDTDNNDDEAPFFDALDELPFSDCADSFSDESDPSPETSFPAVTLCRRRSASVTFPDYELPDSSSGSSVTSEVGWIADTEEIFAGIKKVGNYRSLEEKLDKSELTQNDEISTVTSASRVFLDDSVDSAPGRDGGSLFNLLIFMAGLVIKAVGFQINLITAFVTFPVWGSYKLYKFVINPLRTIRLGRDYFSGKLFKLCEFGFGLISPYIHQWLKKHKSVSNVALRWGWGLLCSFYVCFILFGILASSFVISGVIVRYFVAEPFHMKQVLNFDFTKQRPVAYVPITSCAGVGCGIDCEKHVEDRRRSGFRAVPPGHKVKVTVTMILPESEYNRNLGMFQVRLDFLSNNGEILASSRRPCMIQFRSEPIRLLSTAVKIAPLIAGYISESQTLTVKFKGFSEGNVPTACLKVTIEQRAEYLPGAGIPELYDTLLTLASELPLFKRILWYWKKTIFIWVTMASFMMLVLCTLVFCRPIIMPRSRPRSRAVRRTVYASALGASLSRSTTPDPQLVARAPSPRIPTAGGRATPIDRRSVNGQNSFNGISPSLGESEDLVAALSGMNLSASGMIDEEKHARSQIQHELDNRRNIFNMQNEQNHTKQNSYFNKSDSGNFHAHSFSQSAKGSYQSMGKSGGVGMDSPILNGRGSSYSHYHNVDNSNSSFLNYGLSGYGVSPPSPTMIGSPMGSGNLPPLFESAAAASGMGGLDSGAFGGGLALGPSMLAVTAELQNAGRVGNHSGGSLQVPLMDPLYLQYLRSNEYAAAQAAALNDATINREGMGNTYMDIFGLQKAYLGALLSPQKSQFGVPYMGKSSSLNHGYYGNPAFGLGMSYPGSPLGGPLLPNSPVGSGSPVRHSERNMRFSSGMRNMAGGLMGGWHSEVGGNLDEGFPSSLLDEFKSNKTKCFELAEIAGHVVEFSADQYGSRFIQQKLETATTEEKNMVFNEIMPQALSLMTDVFGNYVIQKFFEHGIASQIRELADQLTGHVLTLSLQMYGCRVIQKAIEVVDLDQQTKMVMELDGQIMRCVRDQNGNHVIQKCIECVPEDAIQFIVSTFYDQVVTLSTHPYGCRVIQRVLEHCHDPKTQRIMMDEVLQSVCMLAQDQYGNYVVQHVLEHGKPHERTAIITKLTGQIVQMSQQKFASNVIEKCLTFGTPVERQTLVNEMLGSTDENEPLQVMMKDQFANYVVQKVLETCDDQQLELILNRIKVHLNALKKYTYGKHIVARVEKLVAAGERRISILTPHPAA